MTKQIINFAIQCFLTYPVSCGVEVDLFNSVKINVFVYFKICNKSSKLVNKDNNICNIIFDSFYLIGYY